MGIILDPTQPVAYAPREGGPTFLLRPPTVADRIKYQEALIERGAKFTSNLDLMALTRKALDRLLPVADNPEAHAESLAAIDEYCRTLRIAIDERKAEKTEATDKAFTDALAFPEAVTDLVEALCEGDRPLRRALAKNAVYWSWAGNEAAKLFLIGWKGLGRFRRDLAGPTEATLKQIDPNDLAMIGIHAEQLMQPDEARTKNSELATLWALRGDKIFWGWEDYTPERPLSGPDGYCLRWLHGEPDLWPDPDELARHGWLEQWLRHAVLRVHPGFIITDEDRTLIDVWVAYRRDGMGGSGYLPFAGGYAQQPAALMRALEVMDAASARVQEKMK